MTDLRKELEGIHAINLILSKPLPVYFHEGNNMYMGGCDEDYYWINGAWFAYQEARK